MSYKNGCEWSPRKPGIFSLIKIGLVCWPLSILAQGTTNSGLENNLSNIYRLSTAETRSISAENPTGEKGQGGMAVEGTGSPYAANLGRGWKMNPSMKVGAGKTLVIADIQGMGAIERLWLTTEEGVWRLAILRVYWDDEKDPSVEVPLGDFFALGWGEYARVSSAPIAVNPGSGFNSYWPMPFRHRAKITIENLTQKEFGLFYQIDYALSTVPKDAAYFHAQFRRVNPVPSGQVFTILDGVKGKGQYVGTYLAWGVNHHGWWGEGEIKFFLDGDREFPSINGTGTEDYFGGSWSFQNPKTDHYEIFSSLYSGLVQVLNPDGLFDVSSPRFGMYRWHIPDPIRFNTGIRVTMQDLGVGDDGKLATRNDDIASVAIWYQTEPHAPFPKFLDRKELETN